MVTLSLVVLELLDLVDEIPLVGEEGGLSALMISSSFPEEIGNIDGVSASNHAWFAFICYEGPNSLL